MPKTRVEIQGDKLAVPANLKRLHSVMRWRAPFYTTHAGQEGVDGGGITRVFVANMVREQFSKQNGLFVGSEKDEALLFFAPSLQGKISFQQAHALRTAGRFLGKALQLGQASEMELVRPLLDLLAGKTPDPMQALAACDPEKAKSYEDILQNTAEGMELYFSKQVSETEEVDFIPNGRNIPVTDANKKDYFAFLAASHLEDFDKARAALFAGIHDIIPEEALTIFTGAELHRLISGQRTLDLASWREQSKAIWTEKVSNSEVKLRKAGCNEENVPAVNAMFWKALEELDTKDPERNLKLQRELLRLVTGSSIAPPNGFAALVPNAFTLSIVADPERLPVAHTCNNRLDLPEYKTIEQLKEKLIKMIEESDGSFLLQ